MGLCMCLREDGDLVPRFLGFPGFSMHSVLPMVSFVIVVPAALKLANLVTSYKKHLTSALANKAPSTKSCFVKSISKFYIM